MKINLEALIVLDAIQQYGSFALAAEKLHRVRSALTYTVKKLEQDLNMKILDRSGHRAKLTPEGEVLLQQGRQLLLHANDIEKHMARIKSGWEERINIAIDDTISTEKIYPLIEKFYHECPQIDLQISAEVLSGCWDALSTGRADLAIGVSGDNPLMSEFGMFPLGEMDFVFAVANNHPLAAADEPLSNDAIMQYRSVVVADTSQNIRGRRSSGTLTGQSVLTVSSMAAKMNAQIQGLGVGYLPKHLIVNEIATKKLIVKKVQKSKPRAHFSVAWRIKNAGKGIEWFLNHLKDFTWKKS